MAAGQQNDCIMPGFGSRVNNALRAQHDHLLPVQQAEGPLPLRRPPRDIDPYYVPLFEDILLKVFDFQEPDVSVLSVQPYI